MQSIPFADLLVTDTSDHLRAYADANWRQHELCGVPTERQWLDLKEVTKQSWRTDPEIRFINCATVRSCGDFFLVDFAEGKLPRIVLHIRRAPEKGDPFPALASGALFGALWGAGGMLVKATGDLDGKMDLPSTLLYRARKELKGILNAREDVLGVYHAGVGYTTFPAEATYTLANGQSRSVKLSAGSASVTLNATAYLRVKPTVIDAIEAMCQTQSPDLAGHVIVTPENWKQVGLHCLDYVRIWVNNYLNNLP